MINLIKTNHDNPDFIGDVKKFEKIVIPLKTISYVKSRVNTRYYLGIKPLLVNFQPDLLWKNDLVLGEKLQSLKPRKTSVIMNFESEYPIVLIPNDKFRENTTNIGSNFHRSSCTPRFS